MITPLFHFNSHQGRSALNCTQPHSSSELKEALAKCKTKFSRLEKWQFSHYRESGFLGWIARLILLIMPSSKRRFDAIEKLEIKLKLTRRELTLPQFALRELVPPASAAKVSTSQVSGSQVSGLQTSTSSHAECMKPISIQVEHTLPPIQAVASKVPSPRPVPAALEEAAELLLDTQLASKSMISDKAEARSLLPEQIPLSAQAQVEQDDFLKKLKGNPHYPDLKAPIDELKKSKSFILAAVAISGVALQYASPELKADKGIVLAAVTQYGYALQYASPELKADKEVVLAAVTQYGWTLQYASPEIQADKDVVLAAVTQFGYALKYASLELRADKDVVRAAITQNVGALQWTSSELKADKKIVLAAVVQCGYALKHASLDLKADKEVVLAAVTQYGATLKFASLELQADREVVLAAVTQDSSALKYASQELQSDKELILAAQSKKQLKQS